MTEAIAVSDAKDRLDLDAVYAFLRRTNWAAGRTRETFEKSVRNSLCFGAYLGEKQIGFARVVTDGSTFAYLCDVFVEESHRGRGVSRRMMDVITAHPELESYRRFVLATQNAHGLYAKYGFRDVPPGSFMEIKRDGV